MTIRWLGLGLLGQKSQSREAKTIYPSEQLQADTEAKKSKNRSKRDDPSWLQLTAADKYKVARFIVDTPPRSREPGAFRISDKGVMRLSPKKHQNPLQNYRRRRLLGEGAYGQVNLYRHRTDGRLYAIKETRYDQKEMLLHVISSDYADMVSVKKIIAIPERNFMYLVMEVLKPFNINEFLRQAKWEPSKVNGDYGVALRDRHHRNKMIRESKEEGREAVEIDFGIADVKVEKLLEQLRDDRNAAYAPAPEDTFFEPVKLPTFNEFGL